MDFDLHLYWFIFNNIYIERKFIEHEIEKIICEGEL